jgi:chromosome segregation ATPase
MLLALPAPTVRCGSTLETARQFARKGSRLPRKAQEETPPQPEEFGTGLRTHLERSQNVDPEPETTAEADADEQELASEEGALEDRRRELAERREQIAAVEATLRVREQRIGEVRARLAEEERRLSAVEVELTTPGKKKEGKQEEGEEKEQERDVVERHVRGLLRERAEHDAERVWTTFEQGLTATHPDGSPDVTARIAAARALLAEAYGPPGGADAESDGSADELAPLRERRREAGSV